MLQLKVISMTFHILLNLSRSHVVSGFLACLEQTKLPYVACNKLDTMLFEKVNLVFERDLASQLTLSSYSQSSLLDQIHRFQLLHHDWMHFQLNQTTTTLNN